MRIAFGPILAISMILPLAAAAQQSVDPQRLSDALDLITQARQDIMDNEPDKALVALTQAINMDVLPPDKQAQALTDRGTLLESAGQIQDAEGDYLGALRVVPGFAAARARLAAIGATPTATTPAAPAAQDQTNQTTPSAGVFLQVGSYKSEAMATDAWTHLQQKHSDILAGLTPDVKRIDLGNRGIWYRLRVAGFADTAAATALCERLKAEGGRCLLTK